MDILPFIRQTRETRDWNTKTIQELEEIARKLVIQTRHLSFGEFMIMASPVSHPNTQVQTSDQLIVAFNMVDPKTVTPDAFHCYLSTVDSKTHPRTKAYLKKKFENSFRPSVSLIDLLQTCERVPDTSRKSMAKLERQANKLVEKHGQITFQELNDLQLEFDLMMIAFYMTDLATTNEDEFKKWKFFENEYVKSRFYEWQTSTKFVISDINLRELCLKPSRLFTVRQREQMLLKLKAIGFMKTLDQFYNHLYYEQIQTPEWEMPIMMVHLMPKLLVFERRKYRSVLAKIVRLCRHHEWDTIMYNVFDSLSQYTNMDEWKQKYVYDNSVNCFCC